MKNYDIRKLNSLFYIDYPMSKYPEILSKENRKYDVIVFQLSFLSGKYICVPFRSEMNHQNGYKFQYSKRSKVHKSGLDFSKIVILEDKKYLNGNVYIDYDEFLEFTRHVKYINESVEDYILGYINHMNGTSIMSSKSFERKYRYSTLKYFHKELGI